MTLPVKNKISIETFLQHHLLADNKNAFRRYKGIELLIKMLREHKNIIVAKALIHVLTENSKINLVAHSLFILISFHRLQHK